MKNKTMIISILAIILILMAILVYISIKDKGINEQKKEEKTEEIIISEDKIKEYANITFEYTEVPEENKEEYINDFTESYKEEIQKSDMEIENRAKKIEGIEGIEKKSKEEKVAEIVSDKVEKKIMIRIEEAEAASKVSEDGYEYSEDGQVGENAEGLDGSEALPGEFEDEGTNGSTNNTGNIQVKKGKEIKSGDAILIEAPEDTVKESENSAKAPKGDK